jgi:hypothetical protein
MTPGIIIQPNQHIMKQICLLLILCFTINHGIQAQTGKTSSAFPDSWTDGQYYTVNGAKLWVVTVGKGEPLLIIPGGPGGAHPAYRQFDSLSVKGNIQLIYFAEENLIPQKILQHIPWSAISKTLKDCARPCTSTN